MKNKYIVFSAIGVELVGIIIACIFIGQYVDQNYGTKGLGIVGFSVLGLTGWLIQVVRMLKTMEKDDEPSQ